MHHASTTENLEEVIKSIGGSDFLDVTSAPSHFAVSSSQAPIKEVSTETVISSTEIPRIENEIVKSLPVPSTTPKLVEQSRREPLNRRTNGRNRSNTRNEDTSTTSRSRSRSRERPTRKPEEPQVSSSTPRNSSRGSRRRTETSTISSRTKGPSVLSDDQELPSRSRTGRRIPNNSRKNEESNKPEKITINLETFVTQKPNSNKRTTSTTQTTTTRSSRNRSRSRFRDVPPVIDEQKLEVLPLFEAEVKTVRPIRKMVKVLTRRKNFNSAEDPVETSATENVQVTKKPEVVVTTPVAKKESVVVETRTESSYRRVTRPKLKKDPVNSGRYTKRVKVDAPKVSVSEVVSRGKKKNELKKSGLTSSEEEIDVSDNYPEHFKALLQAKKHKEVSIHSILREQ